MTIQKLIDQLRAHPESDRIGMIASHLGVVRGTSLSGERVSALEVSYDRDVVDRILNDTKKLEGIVDVAVELFEGKHDVGDEVLAVAVAGETREAVFPALVQTVDRLKSEAARKREYPA
ncbi:MAG: molybdenum cofactor biosynthesis protein MoaE [Desulfobacteraceae bacterium]